MFCPLAVRVGPNDCCGYPRLLCEWSLTTRGTGEALLREDGLCTQARRSRAMDEGIGQQVLPRCDGGRILIDTEKNTVNPHDLSTTGDNMGKVEISGVTVTNGVCVRLSGAGT